MFEKKKFALLYVPVLIEQALVTLTTMLGTMMVSSVGDFAVSGVGLVDSINYFIIFVFNAMATGITVVVSQYIGARNSDLAGKTAGQALVVSTEAAAAAGLVLALTGRFIIKILFGGAEQNVLDAAQVYLIASALTLPLQSVYATAAGIMRATGNSRSPMFASLFANVAYVIVSFVCIHFFHMGVLGAGLGLTASRIVSSGISMYILLSGGGGIVIPRLSFRTDWKVLAPVLRIAMPIGADVAMFNGGKIIVQVFMSGMGTAALAANAIGNSLFGFIMLPGNAMSIVCMTIVGQSFGAGDFKQTRTHMIRLTLLSMGLLAIMCSVIYPALSGIISLYTPTGEAAAIARAVIIMVMMAAPLIWPSSFIVPNMLRATGDAKFTMAVSIASMFILRVVGAWFFGVYLHWGLRGIWFSMLIDWVGRSICFLPRMLSGAWRRKGPITAQDTLE